MKELNHVVLRNGLFFSVKGCFLFTKGQSDNPEGQVEVEPSLKQVTFESFILI